MSDKDREELRSAAAGPEGAGADSVPDFTAASEARRALAEAKRRAALSRSGVQQRSEGEGAAGRPAVATEPAESRAGNGAPGDPPRAGGAAAPPREATPPHGVPGRDSGRNPRRRLARFGELGWAVSDETGTQVIAVDVGVESVCVTSFDGTYAQARDAAHPTMVRVLDPHAFRTLEAFSLEYGLPALERWPAPDVLRGTHDSLLIPSQIGLVDFPAAHVLSGLIGKVGLEKEKRPRDLVLTLPTFLPSEVEEHLRRRVAPTRKGAFRGVAGPLAAAYFYLAPALDGLYVEDHELRAWSREALDGGGAVVLDWGASGLEYGYVTLRRTEGAEAKSELRLALAGTWPSLGGHRLTLEIFQDLKEILVAAILEAGPSEELVPRPLLETGDVPRPPGYDEALTVLRRLEEGPRQAHEEEERRRLHNLVFPTAWRFPAGDEPRGYSPYRRMAVAHFKTLWSVAERLKRLVLSDPPKYRRLKQVSWNLQGLETPFASHIDARLTYPVDRFLDRIEERLAGCLEHMGERLARRGPGRRVHAAVLGMQAASPLLSDAIARAAEPGKPLAGSRVCPASSDPLELKSVVNRGAALLNRDRRRLDFGPPMDVLPFDVLIADCLGNVAIFAAGPIDELSVFQRRIRVEEGFPQFEFYVYSSEDHTQEGSWGAIDFHRPFEFSEHDRVFAVDPRYGFGGALPKLRDLKGDDGDELSARCFDRATPGRTDGSINFRAYAPRGSAEARRLLHFLEYGLTGEFHRKVYLLEREFRSPPKRFDYIYQRYYLSRSQELLVVREWWAPKDGKLVRHKTLHTCQGKTEANEILGLRWGTY